MHFYGPYERFPLLAPSSPNRPPEALVRAYRVVQERLGLARVVVVQPAGDAFDNGCTMAAIGSLGATARAIAVVPLEAPDSLLETLAGAGAVGLRVFMLPGGVYRRLYMGPDSRMAARVRPFGWHLQLQCNGRLLPDPEPRLRGLDAQLVIDHTGKFLEPVSPSDPAVRCLQRLVDRGAYGRLSAPYETSKVGPPKFTDVGLLAKSLAAQAPERMLWATNWPHPGRPAPGPDEAMLLDTLLEWAPDPAQQRQSPVDNPARLYGFT